MPLGKVAELPFRLLIEGVMLVLIASPTSYAHPANRYASPRITEVVEYVNPMIGTSVQGNTIPSVGLPFGMTQWTLQTNISEEKCVPPYVYTDHMISGFRGTHWLSGGCVKDYGSVTIMPITGNLRTDWKDYQTPFSHKDERATPYYYRVELPQYDVAAELTATKRCGMMRFTAGKRGNFYLLISPNSDRGEGYIKVEKNLNEVVGYNPAYRIYQGAGQPAGFSGYFVVQFMRHFDRSGTFSAGTIYKKGRRRGGHDIGAFVHFTARKGERFLVRIGTSFTSIAEARKNLKAEVPKWNFEALHNAAKAIWEKSLSSIRVFGGSLKEKRIFYTALYHTMQQPRLYSDADGSYPMFSKQYEDARLSRGKYYGDFSMWDIFRADIPLNELLFPHRVNNWVRSIILMGKEGGWLPIFPCWNNYTSEMIGDHAIAFIASAFDKGIRDYNITGAYKLMRKNAFDSPGQEAYADGKGRRALGTYLRYGFIPMQDHVLYAFHSNEQVSRTLEYAFDDYSLATVADSLGKEADYGLLIMRAKNYRNVFDSTVGLVRGRNINGTWARNFSPDGHENYVTEGTPRQWTFFVPQDIPGLAALMGGRQRLELALDTLFMDNNYNPGNEPDQQAPFLYDFTPAPWKTQLQVHRIMRDGYRSGASGLPGNDDSGEMSAWYVFAAIGLYPVNPVSNYYMLSSPAFPKIVLRLNGNTKVRIITHKLSPYSKYIYKVEWNGKPTVRDYVKYKSLENGGTLEIFLGNTPSKWASSSDDQPGGL